MRQFRGALCAGTATAKAQNRSVTPPRSTPLRIEDVSAEALLLIGGARAILLQLANPAVGHGVAEHSDFRDRPLDRLHGTLTYLYVIVYGTEAERRLIARRVGEAHARVRSDPARPAQHPAAAGPPDARAPISYDARDPTLQLWVAATLYDTAMRVRELVHGPLSPSDAESLLRDYAIVGTALGIPSRLWPATTAEFDAYWTRCEADLSVDAVTAGVATALLHPTSVPWWAKLLMPSVRVVTAGLLSPELRAAYGLDLEPRRYARVMRVLRAVYPRLPELIRHAPQRHYLRRFRRSLASRHP